MPTGKQTTAKVLVVLYVVWVAVLAGCAIYLYVLPCEGFGCLGVAIGWMAWAVVFLIGLVLGAFARHFALRENVWARWPKPVLWLQGAMGLLLFCLWLRFRFS